METSKTPLDPPLLRLRELKRTVTVDSTVDIQEAESAKSAG